MTSLTELFRNAVSEGSDNGMLIAADAMEESDDTTNRKMGELLRLYVNIQTYVRTSQPIPLEMGNRYNELQGDFNSKATRVVEGDNDWYGEYFKPLGIYYTGLRVSLTHLDTNPNLLSTEPIRELDVRACNAGEPLNRLLRNYRMGYVQRLILNFGNGYRSRYRQGNVAEIASAILNMLGDMMESIHIAGVDDRLKKVQVMFMSNRKIRKGCKLSIDQRSYTNAERAGYTVIKK